MGGGGGYDTLAGHVCEVIVQPPHRSKKVETDFDGGRPLNADMRSPHEIPPAGPSFEHDTVRINVRASHYRAAGADAENVTNGCVYFTFRMKAITATRARSHTGAPPPSARACGRLLYTGSPAFRAGRRTCKNAGERGRGARALLSDPFSPRSNSSSETVQIWTWLRGFYFFNL